MFFEDMVKKYVNFKNITFAMVVILFLFFIFKCKDIAVLFFASFVIACSLNPIVDKLSKRLPRGVATEIVTTGVLLLILAVFIPVCILSFEQISIFMNKLPGYLDNFDEFLFGIPVLKQFHFLASDADSFMEQISMSSSDILTHAVDIGKNISRLIMYLIVSVVLIFNFVSDKVKIKKYFLRSFPSNMRKKAEEVGDIIADKMGGYIIATLVTSGSVGLVMLIGLLIFKIPYALLLAVISAIFDIIPVVGPALALIICLLAVYESGTKAIAIVIGVFIAAQFIENNFVRPYIFGKVMKIHPIVIFLFIFIAAEYIGIAGVVFAPAIAALVAVLYEELYLKKLG